MDGFSVHPSYPPQKHFWMQKGLKRPNARIPKNDDITPGGSEKRPKGPIQLQPRAERRRSAALGCNAPKTPALKGRFNLSAPPRLRVSLLHPVPPNEWLRKLCAASNFHTAQTDTDYETVHTSFARIRTRIHPHRITRGHCDHRNPRWHVAAGPWQSQNQSPRHLVHEQRKPACQSVDHVHLGF
jgi:hypothetical protein